MKRVVAIHKSLYLRLLLIYGLTFLMIMIAIGISFRFVKHKSKFEILHENVARYLAKDIGSPPDLKKAKDLASQIGLQIAIRGPGIEWAVDSHFMDRVKKNTENLDDQNERPWRKTQSVLRIVKIKIDETSFFFSIPEWSKNASPPDIGPALVLALNLSGLVMFMSYRMTRSVFRPLDQMKSAIGAFSEGKWETRVAVGRNDEIGELARTMNLMAEKISRHFYSMRELLIAISHELRSPLTRMKVALEFINDDATRCSLDEEIQLLDRMTEALLERERLSNNTNHLKRTPVNINDLLTEITTPYLSRSPSVKLDLPSTPVRVMVDRARIALALRNLIENAIKHGSHPDKPITVRVKASPEVSIGVEDHGVGLPPEAVARLGEPFFRFEGARSGSRIHGGFGLGLSLAWSIFQAHGASIDVESQEGQGTKFTVHFRIEDSVPSPVL